jgi:GxxExxY protein
MKQDLLYPELSYKVIGCAFEVYNEIGGGHKELTYHNALEIALKNKGLECKSELYYPVKFQSVSVGKNYFDFLVDEKIVVEIKSADRFTKANFDQLINYLVVSNLKLGLLISFGRTEVKYKRILNIELLNKERESLSKTNS